MTEEFLDKILKKIKDRKESKRKKRIDRNNLDQLIKDNFISNLKVGHVVPKEIVEDFMELLYERKEFSIYADIDKNEYHFHEEEKEILLHIYMQWKKRG